MPEKLTEAQARRICEALGLSPGYIVVEEVRKFLPALGGTVEISHRGTTRWRIVQRAAEEEKP